MFRTKNSQPMGYQDRYVGLALHYLSKMKIAVMVRQLDLGHILWCGRVVQVERAHRVRVVRGVQKMPDVGNGVIGFDHVWFHVRDLVMAFLEDELVRCCVTHHRARDFGIVKMRMSQVSRIGAAFISELEASQLVYVRMRMGRVLRVLLGDVADFWISARLH